MQIVFLGKIWILSLFSATIRQILKLSQPTFICFRHPWQCFQEFIEELGDGRLPLGKDSIEKTLIVSST